MEGPRVRHMKGDDGLRRPSVNGLNHGSTIF